MSFSLKPWLKISILNLLFVAALGIIMRYKIAFSFPFLDQKHLQHAHSHFAFTGWVTHTLFVFMIAFLAKYLPENNIKKYRLALIGNLVCAYGMLFAFAYQGYGLVSITFSTLSIFVAYAFAVWYYSDLKKMPFHAAKPWFNAALLFNVLSTIGTFFLAYMMFNKSVQQNQYLASVYFYLHFQYNGWFFFAAMGLLLAWLKEKYTTFTIKPIIFRLFFWACIPAYFLSTLWANLPLWLYVIVIIAAICQVVAWVLFLEQIKNSLGFIKPKNFNIADLFLLLIGFSFSIKLLLQLGSTIPYLSKLAFGFRPIVIAYLHLILLAVFTLYLLIYMFLKDGIIKSKNTIRALIIIVIGVFVNEFILLIQGIASFSYTPVAFVNEALLGAAGLIFLGILFLLIFQLKAGRPNFA